MPPHPSDLLARASCSQWCWSVLGPHGTGNRQSWAGVSDHDGWEEPQVGEPFMAMTSTAQAPRGWVRTPHLTAACPTGRLPARPAGPATTRRSLNRKVTTRSAVRHFRTR
jgi:hypothetical protein